jgi:hypothetical protein
MKVDGRCFCGFVTYIAEVDPAKVCACHCTDCQTLSNSAFRVTVPAEPGTFRLLSGDLKTHIKTADSGNRRALAFCPNCGTSIYSAPVESNSRDSYFGLRVGPITQRNQLRPRIQYWVSSKQPWVDHMETLASFEEE